MHGTKGFDLKNIDPILHLLDSTISVADSSTIKGRFIKKESEEFTKKEKEFQEKEEQAENDSSSKKDSVEDNESKFAKALIT